MPVFELKVDLEPTLATEVFLRCIACELGDCQWKLPWNGSMRGLHTACKIRLEQRRSSASQTFQAVKPP